MDLKGAAARLLMVEARCSHEDIDDTRRRVLRLVRDPGVGGIIIFGGDRDGVARFIADARAAADHTLLIASDLERGLGWKVNGGAVLPSPMAFGASGNPGFAREAGRLTAREARDVGIDLILAPVADLSIRSDNPIVGNRSYGDDPATVARFVEAFVRGCADGGVAAAVKHFPGHGRTAADSHVELPTVGAAESELRETDLAPFRAAVRSGVDAVMTAHVAYPSLDATGVPAGFSERIVRDMLRGELGFDGLVVTDALVMGGAASGGDGARRAFLAGSDILLMPEDVEAAVSAVTRECGEPSRFSQLERSIERVEHLTSLNSMAEGMCPEDNLADRVAEAAVASVGGELAPDLIRRAATVVVVVAGERSRLPECSVLAGELRGGARVHDVVRLDEETDAAGVVRRVGEAEVAVVVVHDEPAAWRGSALPATAVLDGVRDVLAAAPRSVLVLCCAPFVLRALDFAGPVICAWDTAPASERSAAGVLLGRAAPGMPPVALSGA